MTCASPIYDLSSSATEGTAIGSRNPEGEIEMSTISTIESVALELADALPALLDAVADAADGIRSNHEAMRAKALAKGQPRLAALVDERPQKQDAHDYRIWTCRELALLRCWGFTAPATFSNFRPTWHGIVTMAHDSPRLLKICHMYTATASPNDEQALRLLAAYAALPEGPRLRSMVESYILRRHYGDSPGAACIAALNMALPPYEGLAGPWPGRAWDRAPAELEDHLLQPQKY
jgi:hypothetical protein